MAPAWSLLLVSSALLAAATILLAAIPTTHAQPVAPNPAPKAGDVCKDMGWTNVPLGPCAEGTTCEWFKRGVHKCTRAPYLAENEICFDNSVDDAEKARYREFGCVKGTACQPSADAAEAKGTSGLYRCQRLPKAGCFVLAGSAYWPGGEPHKYEAATGLTCGAGGMPGAAPYPPCVCAGAESKAARLAVDEASFLFV